MTILLKWDPQPNKRTHSILIYYRSRDGFSELNAHLDSVNERDMNFY